MLKWLLFGLAAVGNFVFAVITYNNGRVIVPIILVIAGILMAIASIGSAKGMGGGQA